MFARSVFGCCSSASLLPAENVICIDALLRGSAWISLPVGPERPDHDGAMQDVRYVWSRADRVQTDRGCPRQRCEKGIGAVFISIHVQRDHIGVAPGIAKNMIHRANARTIPDHFSV